MLQSLVFETHDDDDGHDDEDGKQIVNTLDGDEITSTILMPLLTLECFLLIIRMYTYEAYISSSRNAILTFCEPA